MTMRSRAKIAAAAAVVLAVWLAAPAVSAQRDRYEEPFERTEALARDGKVYLNNISGDVEVKTWANAEVRIEALKVSEASSEARAKENAAEVTIEITREGSLLRIETKYPRRRSWGRDSFNVSVRYTLTVPDQAAVEVKSVSGDVTAAGVGGVLKLNSVSGEITANGAGRTADLTSVSGDIVVKGVKGDAWLKTVSGDVEARDINGSIDAESVSGDVELLDVTGARDLDAKTVSGNIVYRGDIGGQGRFSLSSHSGNVRLTLPAGAAFDFEAETFSGVVESDFPVQMSGKISPRELRGSVGEGGPTLRLKSFSGSIELRKR